MKRYAVVRVDDAEEGIKWLDILDEIVKKRKIIIDYGDTKEQLINKIETAVAIMRNKMENKEVYLDRAVATFIVEFLGVEE